MGSIIFFVVVFGSLAGYGFLKSYLHDCKINSEYARLVAPEDATVETVKEFIRLARPDGRTIHSNLDELKDEATELWAKNYLKG